MRRSRLSSLVASLKISASIRSRAVEPTISSRRARADRNFSADTRPLAAAHQDFVLDETFKLTDSLLEVLLLSLPRLLADRRIPPRRPHRRAISRPPESCNTGPSIAFNRTILAASDGSIGAPSTTAAATSR